MGYHPDCIPIWPSSRLVHNPDCFTIPIGSTFRFPSSRPFHHHNGPASSLAYHPDWSIIPTVSTPPICVPFRSLHYPDYFPIPIGLPSRLVNHILACLSSRLVRPPHWSKVPIRTPSLLLQHSDWSIIRFLEHPHGLQYRLVLYLSSRLVHYPDCFTIPTGPAP